MAVSRKVEREIIRNKYVELLKEYLISLGEDVQTTKSNEFGFPVVGCEGNEDSVVIVVKVPTGANKGLEPFDLYGEAEDYERKLKEKAEKKRKDEEKKAKKIAKDKEIREKKKSAE